MGKSEEISGKLALKISEAKREVAKTRAGGKKYKEARNRLFRLMAEYDMAKKIAEGAIS